MEPTSGQSSQISFQIGCFGVHVRYLRGLGIFRLHVAVPQLAQFGAGGILEVYLGPF